MGFDSKSLPNSFRKCIAPDERAQSVALQTHEEASEKHAAKAEKALQQQIAQYLRLRGVWFCQSAMHKRTTTPAGTPDFILAYKGVPVALEAKSATGKQTKEQIDTMALMQSDGWIYRVIRSLDEIRCLFQQIDSEKTQ